jgi:phosphatidate cytidylyltransferase
MSTDNIDGEGIEGPEVDEGVEDFEDFLTDELDEFTRDDYLNATTEEYRGLAESMARSADEEVEMQAVAAHMPGLEAGVVGFDDVTGETHVETYEAQGGPSDTLVRAATGVVLVTLVLAMLAIGGGWLALLIGVFTLVSMVEFYSALRQAGYAPLALFGFLGAIGVLAAAWFSSQPLSAVSIVIGLTIVAVVFWYALLSRSRPLENASFTVFGVVWIAALLAFAMPIIKSEHSQQLILAIIAVTALFDAGSYFVGRALGRVSLAPGLSPHKTFEGLVGGVVVAFVAGFLLSVISWFEFDLTAGLWLAAAVSVFAPLGDLAESLVKRAVGVKDMGALLPGHGGLIDRLDSYLFTIPVGYVVFLWLGFL